jgi:hypothetical protein
MAPGDITIGRRVDSFSDIDRPGDYYGPSRGDGEYEHVFFLKPNARDADAPAIARSVQHVRIPPHTYRECPDGSLEIRQSIGDTRAEQPDSGSDGWHGFLDEGHQWRQV